MGATVSGRGCVLAGDQYSECSPDRSHLNPLMRTSTPQHAPGRRCRRGHHRAHVRNERPTRMLSGQRAHEGAQATTYRANVRISGPRCPISGSWANFVEWRLGRNRAGRVLSHHQSRAPTAGRPSARIEQETDLPGPPQADGHEKALPKECMVEMQNPHRWIAPRGAAARPKGLEPPTF